VRVTITSVDYAPEDLYEQVPILVELLRPIPGSDRPDYWLGRLLHPVEWYVGGEEREVTHLVVSTRLMGGRFVHGARDLPISIAYVKDLSVLGDDRLEFSKCMFVALGACDVG